MTVFEDGVEIKSLNKNTLKPIFIDRDNIEDIYIEQQDIDYSTYYLAPDKTKKIYRVFLQCKQPVYLKLGDKYVEKFILFADDLNENEYQRRIEPNLKLVRDKLNLPEDIEYKVLKEKFVRRR